MEVDVNNIIYQLKMNTSMNNDKGKKTHVFLCGNYAFSALCMVFLEHQVGI